MGVMPADSTELQILQELSHTAQGFDVFGRRISPEAQAQAIQQYATLKAHLQSRDLQDAKLGHEDERVRIETERMALEASREHLIVEARLKELELEEERVKVEKARVVVEMLEAAGKAGLPQDELSQMAQAIQQHLIPTSRRLTADVIGDEPEDG